VCEQIILFEMANGEISWKKSVFLLITITLSNNIPIQQDALFHISLQHDNDSLIVDQYLD